MKRRLLKLLWWLFLVFLVLLTCVVVFGVTLSLGWPWWVAVFILLGLAGLGLSLLFLKKVLLRRREQRFVQQIIAQDEAHQQSLSAPERQQARELQERWKQSVQKLKKSHLRQQGNPLYVLPWYLIIGESGSGKTTAIHSAGLSSPFAEVERISGLSGTKNCDWWFFEEAVVLDVAGRYAIPVDEGRDRDEWQRFLKLLVRYRRKEPLNGLIVTLAADKALQSSEDELLEDGKSIRARINELMRVLGAKFPVYLLITKCDLIMGMTSFCEILPEESLNQAMGVLNPSPDADPVPFSTQAVDKVTERLKDLRLLEIHHGHQTLNKDPSVLIFPDEFKRLDKGLQAFVQGAFAQNPYQETPRLRGVYFSSGRQEGMPFSHLLHSLGLMQHRDLLPGTSRGLFLHDFFAKILPADRRLFTPTKHFLQWRSMTRNIGLTAWITIVLALCGLLSLSFLKNLSTIHSMTSTLKQEKPVRSGDFMTDTLVMDRFREAITKLEEANQGWWIPRFNLDASRDVEQGVKEAYLSQFKQGFLIPLDAAVEKRMTDFSAATPDTVIADHVEHLTRRINLIQDRVDGAGLEDLQGLEQPRYRAILGTVSEKGAQVPEIRETYSQLYLTYLGWREDTSVMNSEMNRLQAWLKRLLTDVRQDLNWLLAWAELQPDLSPVDVIDFWGGSLPLDSGMAVSKAFTSQGYSRLTSFVEEIETALPDPLILAAQKNAFIELYHNLYLKAWQNYATDFSNGMNTLASRAEWQQVIQRLGTEQGPYFALLGRIRKEVSALDMPESNQPEWLAFLSQVEQARRDASSQLATKGKAALGKVFKKGRKALNALDKIESKDAADTFMAGKVFQTYSQALDSLRPLAASRQLAFETAGATLSKDPASSDSPFFEAHRAIDSLKATLGHSSNQVFWDLLHGPVDTAWQYALKEAGCSLQAAWESKVLAEVRGAPDQSTVNKLLLGDNGFAWSFVKGLAAPFVSRNVKKGYHPRERYGAAVDFQTPFFTYLNQGAMQQVVVKDQYRVAITALPANVNSSARYQPHAVRLTLRCGEKDQTLVNLMFPTSETFIWSPGKCGDVLLQVDVHNEVLTRRYSGEYAFPRFLRDFARGEHTFRPGDFEEATSVWDRLGINRITMQYKLSGHRPVISLLRAGLGAAPRTIATCWDE